MPRRMELPRIAKAGERRKAFLEAADRELDKIVAELHAAGDLANVKLAAELAGVPRSTLYRRLPPKSREGAKFDNAKILRVSAMANPPGPLPIADLARLSGYPLDAAFRRRVAHMVKAGQIGRDIVKDAPDARS